MKKTAFWGDRDLAKELATAVGTRLGSDAASVDASGPAFVFDADDLSYAAFGTKAGAVTEFRAARGTPLALVSAAAVPRPPMPMPMPDGLETMLAFVRDIEEGYAAETVRVAGCPDCHKSPIWAKPALARELAGAFATGLGSDDATGAGPAFVYDAVGDDLVAFRTMDGAVGEFRAPKASLLSVARVADVETIGDAMPVAAGYREGVAFPKISGSPYAVEVETCRTMYGCDDKLRGTAVWGKLELARDLARAIGPALGSDETGAGPAFVYAADDRGYSAFGTRGGAVTAFRADRLERLTVARPVEHIEQVPARGIMRAGGCGCRPAAVNAKPLPATVA